MRPEGPAPTTRTSQRSVPDDEGGDEGSGVRRGKGALRIKVVSGASSCAHSATRVAGMLNT